MVDDDSGEDDSLVNNVAIIWLVQDSNNANLWLVYMYNNASMIGPYQKALVQRLCISQASWIESTRGMSFVEWKSKQRWNPF